MVGMNTTQAKPDTLVSFDGALRGATLANGSDWSFEGRSYDTPAGETDVITSVAEALEAPADALVAAVGKLTFSNPHVTHTAHVLSALAAAYAAECGDGSEGTDPIVTLLQETARRVAVIEALTI